MKSIAFPKMFENNSTKIISDYDATKRNLESLLLCEKGEFISDPFFGIRLKRYIYEQNNYILRDIIIDEIYSQINVFMPQVTVTRKDITIEKLRGKLIVKIKALNKLDFTINTYDVVLLREDEQ